MSYGVYVETCAHTLLSPKVWQCIVQKQLGYVLAKPTMSEARPPLALDCVFPVN